jgi:hypothetical protein
VNGFVASWDKAVGSLQEMQESHHHWPDPPHRSQDGRWYIETLENGCDCSFGYVDYGLSFIE